MAAKRIALQHYTPIQKEFKAAAAGILPGMLVERDSSSEIQVHANAGETAMASFALEDELRGRQIDQVYVNDNQVQVGYFRTGDVVYARLANGETAVIGSELESNGNGYLRVKTDDSAGGEHLQSTVGISMDAVDMSDSSGADPSGFIRVEIL